MQRRLQGRRRQGRKVCHTAAGRWLKLLRLQREHAFLQVDLYGLFKLPAASSPQCRQVAVEQPLVGSAIASQSSRRDAKMRAANRSYTSVPPPPESIRRPRPQWELKVLLVQVFGEPSQPIHQGVVLNQRELHRGVSRAASHFGLCNSHDASYSVIRGSGQRLDSAQVPPAAAASLIHPGDAMERLGNHCSGGQVIAEDERHH